jgi:hypothetical protein
MEVTVGADGARIGRASKNDVVLSDAVASRHHCRLFLKPGDGLWISDLGSANGTIVNDREVREAPLRTGDLVTIGDSILKVLDDERHPRPDAVGPRATAGGPGPAFAPRAARPNARLRSRPLLLILGLVVAGLAVWGLRGLRTGARRTGGMGGTSGPVEIRYEKVSANTNNIFRYQLDLSGDRLLVVTVEDLAAPRPVQGRKPLDPALVEEIARSIEEAGFFSLEPHYRGANPHALESRDITVTIGRRTHRSRVVNRTEPEAFQRVREHIEQCGLRESGLPATP